MDQQVMGGISPRKYLWKEVLGDLARSVMGLFSEKEVTDAAEQSPMQFAYQRVVAHADTPSMELSPMERSAVKLIANAHGIPLIEGVSLDFAGTTLHVDGHDIEVAEPQWQIPFSQMVVQVAGEQWILVLNAHLAYIISPSRVIIPSTLIPAVKVREAFGL